MAFCAAFGFGKTPCLRYAAGALCRVSAHSAAVGAPIAALPVKMNQLGSWHHLGTSSPRRSAVYSTAAAMAASQGWSADGGGVAASASRAWVDIPCSVRSSSSTTMV